jgi:hypothetical protein
LASEDFGEWVTGSCTTEEAVETVLTWGEALIIVGASFAGLTSGFWITTAGFEGSHDLGIDLIWACKGFGDLIPGFRGLANRGWGVRERGG